MNLRKFEFNAFAFSFPSMQVLIDCVPWDPPKESLCWKTTCRIKYKKLNFVCSFLFCLSDSFTDAAIANVAQKQTNGQINERKLEVCMPLDGFSQVWF